MSLMSWRTHPIVLALRSLGRALGVNSRLARVLARSGYESSFEEATLARIRPGDCVWDVGANVGLYSLKFLDAVGPRGAVFAFEPSPTNRTRLVAALASQANATVLPVALGDCDGTMKFEQGADALGATSRLLDGDGDGIDVRVARGDSLIASGDAARPNVVKIDTEGFELDVLRGLFASLESKSLRALCVEVHFRLMSERGIVDGPRLVERLIRQAGFRVRWTDASHIVATRE